MHRLSAPEATTYIVSSVELAFAVNLRTLREALKSLTIDGRRWWIASDPHDAIERGYITVGHGDEACVDRLNTLSFRVPLLTKEPPWGGTDDILLLFDATTVEADEPGFYLSKEGIVQDDLEDFLCFFRPVKAALLERMQAGM